MTFAVYWCSFERLPLGVVVVLRVYITWTKKVAGWNNDDIFKRYIRPILEPTIGALIFFGWGLITSSFFVGMIKDVGLGLKILGYGSAFIGGLLMVAGLLAGLLWRLVSALRVIK
jgi:hypothetical protein